MRLGDDFFIYFDFTPNLKCDLAATGFPHCPDLPSIRFGGHCGNLMTRTIRRAVQKVHKTLPRSEGPAGSIVPVPLAKRIPLPALRCRRLAPWVPLVDSNGHIPEILDGIIGVGVGIEFVDLLEEVQPLSVARVDEFQERVHAWRVCGPAPSPEHGLHGSVSERVQPASPGGSHLVPGAPRRCRPKA